jgi:putative oxidoreductase
MGIAYAIGRVFLPIIFIVLGVQTIWDVQPIAKLLVDNNIPIPDEITPYLSYLGNIPKHNLLGYIIGGLEVICGLMIVVGLKARWAALVLIVYSACSIFFVHHFWDMEGIAFTEGREKALMHLSIMGGLLLLIAGGPSTNDFDRH